MNAAATNKTLEGFPHNKPPLWALPTILSLDAPAVVLAWQALFAHCAKVPLLPHHWLLLGSSVWLAYTADRWIEGWSLTLEDVQTFRHYLPLRWRWPIFALWSLVLSSALALAAHSLTHREWLASLGLLVPTCAYLLSHQWLHKDHPWRLPKEFCVAIIIAGGAALYPATSAYPQLAPLLFPAFFFGALSLLNCLLISGWEREVDLKHKRSSLALQHPHLHRLTPALAPTLALLALLSATLSFRHPVIGLHAPALFAISLSAALLALLNALHGRFGQLPSRVLADLALLTPLLFLFL